LLALFGEVVLADSILRFSLIRKNAIANGRIIKILADCKTERKPPRQFGVGVGYPSSFEVALKRTGTYLDASQDAVDPDIGLGSTRGGIHLSKVLCPISDAS